MTETTPYLLMGGEPALRSLVDRFYFYMDIMPEAQGIRDMHAENLNGAKDNLFIEEYGHPMLRYRHLPFKIGPAERDQWMMCMNRALTEIEMSQALRSQVKQALGQLATHMINVE